METIFEYIVTAILGLLTTAIGWFFSKFDTARQEINTLKTKVEKLEKDRSDQAEVPAKIASLETTVELGFKYIGDNMARMEAQLSRMIGNGGNSNGKS